MRRLPFKPSGGPAQLLIPLAGVALLIATPAPAAEEVVRQINISEDSLPGWLPSQEQENAARRSLDAYLTALDKGQVTTAYAMLAPRRQLIESPSAFAAWVRDFAASAGPVVQRRVLKLTWTKDSPQAPFPGVYALFDLASRFATLDRHCSRIVLYQAPAGGEFQVAREEDTFMDNATAVAIETHQSKADVDRAWQAQSAHCDNYDVHALDASAAAPLAAGGPGRP